MSAYVNSSRDNFYGIYSTQPMSQFVDLEKLENNCVSIEKGLNMCGWIPFVSTHTGTARALYALAGLVTGVSVAAFKTIKALNEQDSTVSARLWTEAGVGLIYAMHGLGNAIRAFFEMIPFINLVCLGYDLAGMRLRYAVEGIQPIQLPQSQQEFQAQFPIQLPTIQMPSIQMPFQFSLPFFGTRA